MTVGDKIVETLSSNGMTSERKTIHTTPPLLHSNVGCLMFSAGSSNNGKTLNRGDGGGKAFFSLFLTKIAKLLEWYFRAKCF